jgi:hypothetical protein
MWTCSYAAFPAHRWLFSDLSDELHIPIPEGPSERFKDLYQIVLRRSFNKATIDRRKCRSEQLLVTNRGM